MMQAEEARKRVDEKIEGEAQKWLEEVEKKIEGAVLCKSYSTSHTYNSTIFHFVKKHMESKGYKVEYVASNGYGSGGSYVRIEW